MVGGRSIGDDIFKLEHGVHMISGTPGIINIKFSLLFSNLGRVFDMINRRVFKTHNIKILILD